MGQGDCDSDSQCAGDLVCGTNNCIVFDTAWPDSAFDCCTTGKKPYNCREYSQPWYLNDSKNHSIQYDLNDAVRSIVGDLVALDFPNFL